MIATEELKKLREISDSHKLKIESMEPIVEDIAKWKQRGIGVIMFIGFVSAALGAAIVALWNKFINTFQT